jgi:GNAT superfamily N-acetyltransferase
MTPSYIIEPLDRRHDRDGFDCEEESLNEFLKRFARQNDEKGLGRTFVALKPGDPAIIGYYTLSTGAVGFEQVPAKLPRYPVPVAHIGRLAVDRRATRQGLGAFLLIDALRRIMLVAGHIGIYAVEVYALNEEARSFYLKYGFKPLLDDSQHLYLSILCSASSVVGNPGRSDQLLQSTDSRGISRSQGGQASLRSAGSSAPSLE